MDRASTAQFSRAVNALKAIASKDETRWNLNGICFEKGRAIATDGHRACILTAEMEGPFETPFILPLEYIPTVKAKHTLHVMAPEGSQATLNVLNGDPNNFMSSTAPLIDADYPDIDQVRPQGDPVYSVKLDAKYVQELLDVHRQAGAKFVTFKFYAPANGSDPWTPCRIESPGVESILMPATD